MNAEERALARLLAFEAIYGVECESSYGSAPVTFCFTPVSTSEMITVRCAQCGTWITESVPMRALDALITFKRFIGIRPIRERIDDHLDDYHNGFLVLTAAEVPLNLRGISSMWSHGMRTPRCSRRPVPAGTDAPSVSINGLRNGSFTGMTFGLKGTA